jgi:predicted nuclease of predicted toxin-antitoxin system
VLRLAGDENFNHHIVTGLRRRISSVDILTVRTAGLKGTPDLGVLAWAAQEGRVVLTHDHPHDEGIRIRKGRSR